MYKYQLLWRSGRVASEGKVSANPAESVYARQTIKLAAKKLAYGGGIIWSKQAKERNLDQYIDRKSVPGANMYALLVEPTKIPSLGHCYDTLAIKWGKCEN